MAPITAFPDFDLLFLLYIDASTLGLGAISAHVQGGRERIIYCASCALTQTDKNYPATKLEWLAIVWATGKLHPCLMSNKFDIFKDHYALQCLKSMRTGSALLRCWSVPLEEFDFAIHHQLGK